MIEEKTRHCVRGFEFETKEEAEAFTGGERLRAIMQCALYNVEFNEDCFLRFFEGSPIFLKDPHFVGREDASDADVFRSRHRLLEAVKQFCEENP